MYVPVPLGDANGQPASLLGGAALDHRAQVRLELSRVVLDKSVLLQISPEDLPRLSQNAGLVDLREQIRRAAELRIDALREAIACLENGTVARSALGDDVVDHYLNYARTEQGLFDRVVTDWERARLYERG